MTMKKSINPNIDPNLFEMLASEVDIKEAYLNFIQKLIDSTPSERNRILDELKTLNPPKKRGRPKAKVQPSNVLHAVEGIKVLAQQLNQNDLPRAMKAMIKNGLTDKLAIGFLQYASAYHANDKVRPSRINAPDMIKKSKTLRNKLSNARKVKK